MAANRHDRPAWEWLSESDNLNRDTLILFSDAKLGQLIDLMGPQAEISAVQVGLQMTVRHYVEARFLASRRPPGAAEWKRMVRFGEAARAYAKALEGLMAKGNADQRLTLDLFYVPADRTGPGDAHFKRMFGAGGPRGPLRQLQRLVEATARAADRLTVEPFDADSENPATEYLNLIAPVATPDDKRRIETYCLTEGLTAFRRVWMENSDKPFNVGKYHSDIGGFAGEAIAAAHLVMKTIDPVFTERRVATVIRDINNAEP